MTRTTTPLRHLAEVRVSNVDKKSLESELPVRLCNYTDVYYSESIRDDREFMTATATASQVARFRLRVGDSIITKDSETADDIAVASYVADEAPDLVCGYHLALLRPRPSEIDARFLTWALRSDFLRDQFTVRATGVTRFGLKHEAILGVDVPLLDLPMQRQVADFLDDQVARIDEIIRLREDQSRAAEDRWRADFSDRVQALKSSSPVVALRRFATSVEQGSSPLADSRCAGAGEFGVLKTSCVKGGEFRSTENKFLEAASDVEARYLVRNGDLLITRGSGSPKLVADVAVVDGLDHESPSLLLSDLLYRIRLRHADPVFVAEILLSPQLRGEIAASTRGAVGGTIKVRGEDILGWAVPLPQIASQVALGGELRSSRWRLRALQSEMTAQVELLRDRKRSLITAAVTGEFDVSTASGRGVA